MLLNFVKVELFLERHQGTWGSGGVVPFVLELGIMWR